MEVANTARALSTSIEPRAAGSTKASITTDCHRFFTRLLTLMLRNTSVLGTNVLLVKCYFFHVLYEGARFY